jgi:GH24 family phage-related lysozyme (muramidase)
MISLKRIVKEIMEEALPPAPPPEHQQSSSEIIDDFANYIKSVENAQKSGYDKDRKLWFPHKSYEGGMPTIGYGHKIKNDQELKSCTNGVPDNVVSKLLLNDLMVANKKVHEYIKRKYKVNLTLSKRQNEILVDYAFNLGGLDKFPKFVDAVLRNQWDIVRNEYIRKSGGKELTGRNKAFYNRYLR